MTDDDDFFDLLRDRGRRARRRYYEATREAGHLRVWFVAQGHPEAWYQRDARVYRQIIWSWKTSCQCSMCRFEASEKQVVKRRERYQAKRELKKLLIDWSDDE